ncbi:MAG TPA: DNA-binding domain-containing protein [Polyangiaceae bacterium]|nr:DNA-binding domain-containing protein [Polyangiaceae bacterium]
MSAGVVPPWLYVFQSRFTAMLRTPLDPSSGTFSPAPSRYDTELRHLALPSRKLGAAERLAVYNRQYWIRLFQCVQSAFPLTARLVGYFPFNGYVSRFLSEAPPRSWNIDQVPDGFETFLEKALAEERPARADREALLEAAALDVAWRRVFLAPPCDEFRPTAEDAARLTTGRLRPSAAVAILRERWALAALRARLVADASETTHPLPEQHPSPRAFALVRRPGGVGELSLAPLEARLFELLAGHPVSEALGLLEAECPEPERAALPANAQRWLARSVELGFWSGLE